MLNNIKCYLLKSHLIWGMEKEPTVEKNWAPIDSTKLLKSTGKHQKLNTSKY